MKFFKKELPFQEPGTGNKNQESYNAGAQIHNNLGSPPTWLAYRDLPALLDTHLKKKSGKTLKVLDYGCGSGTSTQEIARALNQMGIDAELYGVDINKENIKLAKQQMPDATFKHIQKHQKLGTQDLGSFLLIISNFVLLENKTEEMQEILTNIHSLLDDQGIALFTNCNTKMYNKNFKWKYYNNNFEENEPAPGQSRLTEDQTVKVEVTNHDNATFTFNDYYHSGKAYRTVMKEAGLSILEVHKPKGKASDNIAWESEITKSPYKIHITTRSATLFYPPTPTDSAICPPERRTSFSC